MKTPMGTLSAISTAHEYLHGWHQVTKKVLRPQPHGRMPHASLVIDAAGRVVTCTPRAARLLRCAGASLAGRAIREVFPELPFSANTLGYNLAYAVFQAAGKRWVRRVALLEDGRKIHFETTLSSVAGESGRQIVMGLRPVQLGRRQPLAACAS